MLCLLAGGFYIWHRSRAEAAAKQAAQVADDAIQNARILPANKAPATNASPAAPVTLDMSKSVPLNAPPAPQYLSTDPNAGTSPNGGQHPATIGGNKDWFAQNAPKLYGNATLREDGVLFSCDTLKLRGLSDILASMPDGTRMRVLRFGYEWGAYGNYGAKIQLANGLTGCILDGNTLKLDGE
ncbi:MAG: hypothetical protein WBD23_00765 [Candidatus Acidiferrales bacterium]